MKIFVDARVLNAPFMSGVPYYALELLRALERLEKKNKYILFSNAFRKREPLMMRFGFERPKFSEVNHRIPNRPANLFAEWLGFPRFAKNADVAWSPHHVVPLRTAGEIPHVVTVHDLAFERFPQYFSAKERLWHTLPWPRRQARRASHIIAVSEATKKDLVEMWGILEEKITVVYSGIHEAYLNEGKGSQTPSGNRTSSKRLNQLDKLGQFGSSWLSDMNFPFILIAGTLEPRKNHIGLIKAFNLFAGRPEFLDMKLIIAGNRGWKWKDIEREAKASPFVRRILFMEGLSDAELAALYQRANVFCYPSFYEGFGFPPLEAQSSGCPVVASHEGGLAEALGDSAMFVSPENPQSIADGLEKVLSDGDLRKELIKRGKKNVKRFSWDKCALETLEVLHSVSETR